MDTVSVKNKEKNNTGKKVAIILFVTFILVPIGIITIIYKNNKNFQTDVNNILSKMPGVIGEHFKNLPTEDERNAKIIYLANYFLSLDTSVASDKIYIIKKEDEKLYINIIKEMNDISSKKTEEIVVKVRNTELRKDLLFSIYEDAQKDEEEKFMEEVSRIEKQDILITLIEVEKKYSDREFLKILKELKNEKLGEILYYSQIDYREYILNTLSSEKRMKIEGYIFEKDNEINKLVELAKLYETKPIDIALNAIGNNDNYEMEKLAIIYRNLSVMKSAELLSNIKDEIFVEELFSAIIRYEQLRKSDLNITSDINKTMEFINEYNLKIKDLVTIYEKMSPKKVADIINKMIENNDTITVLELNSEEIVQLSDSTIIIDVLSLMKNQTLSKVLDYMEPEKASQVTRLLAKPKSND